MLVRDLSQDDCHELLSRLGFGRIACTNGDQPYVVPTYFVHEHPFLYCFATAGQKVEWMRANPLVCLEADEVRAQEDWSSVVVFGRYEELPDTPKYRELRQTAHQILEHRTSWWKLAIAAAQTRPVDQRPTPILYRIHIDSLTGHRASPDPKS